MKLSFTDLIVCNFKSFYGEHHLPLADFDDGLHFIRGNNKLETRLGSNGSGKTTLVADALCWCLYGKTPEGLRNPDIRPWGIRRNQPTWVEVRLKASDKSYLIFRQTSPNEFTIDGAQGADDVAQLTGLNFELFCHTIVLGQGKPLFFDLPPRNKMQLFVDVLELDRWDQRSEKAAARVRELDQERAQADGERLGVTSQIDQAERLLASATAQADEWEQARLQRVDEAKRDLERARRDYARAKKKKDAADLADESANLDLQHLRDEIAKSVAAIAECRRLESIMLERKRGIDREISRLELEDQSFGKDGKCPICRQTIKGTVVEGHKRELQRQIDTKTREFNKLNHEQFKKDIDRISERLARDRATLKEKEDAANTASAEYKLLAPMVAELAAKIANYERDIDAADKEPNPYQEQISKLKRDARKLAQKLKDLDDEIGVLDRAIERNKFWIRGFKDIRLLVIEDVLQELEITTNAMLADVGLIDWTIKFDIEKETKAGTVQRGLNVFIESPAARAPVRWESWSGGEGQRLRLVGALALSDVLLNHAGIQPDFEVLDEPTRHLSLEGVADLCEFLAARATQISRRTLYVDHMATESSFFRSILTVNKDKKGSYITFD